MMIVGKEALRKRRKECVMEWDDLDRELAEYNAEIAPLKEASEEKKEPVKGWIPFGEEEESAVSETDYQLQYQQLENVRHRLEGRLEEARGNYTGVEEAKKKEGITTRNEWIATTAFFILIYLIMGVLSNTQLFFAWLLLLIAIVVFMVRQYRILILRAFRYRIRCITDNPHPYVESRRIKTYQKEEEYWHHQMSLIAGNLEHLKTWEKKLQANRGLTEEEFEEMKRLMYVTEVPIVYKDEKPLLRDWIAYRFGKKA